MAKSVKLADIAAIVGVSTVTVSKALSDQKGVSEEVREKIKKLAEEMGYKPPSANKKNIVSENYNIGVIIPEHFLSRYDSFYWMLYQTITKFATTKGCFSLMEVISATDEAERNLPKFVLEKKVDGLILMGGMQKEYLKVLQEETSIPMVYLDFYDKDQECDAVISNNFYGAYMLTNYLYRMGHRKIAYVGTLLVTESITDRYLGYLKSVMEHGLDSYDDWVIPDRDKDTGMIDLNRCLQLPKIMPTAFVCNCDLTAGYLIKKLQSEGFRVPEDVSVVGFDNFIHPGMCDVGITTYEVDVEGMSQKAVEHLIDKIADPKKHIGTTIVDGCLIYKESVKRV